MSHNRLTKSLLKTQLPGKNKRGRARKKWEDDIKEESKKRELTNKRWTKKSGETNYPVV